MFYKFFKKKSPATLGHRARTIENSFTADLAAELLVAPTALMHENSPVADKLKMYVQLTQVMQQEIGHRAPG